MMDSNNIQIPITSESVNNLKRAVSVLKDAYKNSAGKQGINNEAALYVFVLPTANDLINDIEASYNSLNSYEAMTLDEIKNPTKLNIDNYDELDNITGNYPISEQTLKEARSEVNDILSASEGVSSISQAQVQGNAFSESAGAAIQDPVPENRPLSSVSGGIISGGQNVSAKKYAGKNERAILKQCIPCDLRPPKGLKPGRELLGLLENDLVARYKRLISQIESLFNNTSVYDDICSIAGFFDSQCVPDIRAIIAVLSSLYRKLLDIKIFSPTNLFLGLIRPFFSPLLNGLTDLLDKYLQLIIAPVNCVINSLDSQLAKLETDRVLNSFDSARVLDLNKRINFLRRKKSQLIARKETLLEQNKDLQKKDERNVLSPDSPAIRNLSQVIQKNNDEIEKIDEEIQKLDGRFGYDGDIGKAVQELERIEGGQKRRENPGFITRQRGNLNTVRKELGSGLRDLRREVVNGRNMINEAISAWQKELQRFLFGRAATSTEMLDGLADLQRLARLISLATALSKFYKQAKSGNLCNNKDPRKSLGFLISNSSPRQENGESSTPIVVSATDEDGESILLVTSPGGMLELEGQDETKKFSDLSKDNASGVIPDIGSIANKIVRSTDEFGNEATISVVKFNLCGKPSASTDQTLEKIKDWASNLG